MVEIEARQVTVSTGTSIPNGALTPIQEALGNLTSDFPEAVELAELVSLAVHVEPPLLRRVRMELLPGVNVSAEADLWFSNLVESRGPHGFVLMAQAADLLRIRLAAEPTRLQAAWQCIDGAHSGASPAVRLQERVAWLSLSGRFAEVESELLSAVKALLISTTRALDLARWAASAVPRLPESARNSPAGWLLALGAGAKLGGRRVLAGTPPDEVANRMRDILPVALEKVQVGVRLLESGLELSYPALSRAHMVSAMKTDPVLLRVGQPGVSKDLESLALRWGDVRTIAVAGDQGLVATPTESVRLGVMRPHLTVHVTYEAELPLSLSFRFEGETDADSRRAEAQMEQDPREYATRILDEYNSSSTQRDPGELAERVTRLLPEEFWVALRETFQRVGEPPLLLIVEDGISIPWELALVEPPLSPDAPPFLCAQAAMARWRKWDDRSRAPNLPRPLEHETRTIVVVASSGGTARSGDIRSLAGVEQEAEDLVLIHQADRIPSSFVEVSSLLRGERAADIIHLAGQGDFDQEQGSQFVLDDGTRIGEETLRRLGGRLAGGPVIFLNAQSAGQGRLAEALIAAGASAVIASGGYVHDETAVHFAQSFYETAFTGVPVAEALRRTLATVGPSSRGNGVDLTYQYTGHPALVLWRSFPCKVLDASRGKEVLVLSGHSGIVRSATFSPSGRQILTVSNDATARIWRAQDGRELRLYSGHASPISACALAPDFHAVATADTNGQIRVWDPATGETAMSWTPASPAVVLAISEKGELFAASADASLFRWADLTGRPPQRYSLDPIKPPMRLFDMSQHGSVLAADESEAEVWLVDAVTGLGARRLSFSQQGTIASGAFSSDGSAVVLASPFGTVSVLDTRTGQVVTSIHVEGNVMAASLSPDNERLATTMSDTISLWDAQMGSPLFSFPNPAPRSTRLRWSPDGSRFILSSPVAPPPIGTDLPMPRQQP